MIIISLNDYQHLTRGLIKSANIVAFNRIFKRPTLLLEHDSIRQ
jgi:hypothetical protein